MIAPAPTHAARRRLAGDVSTVLASRVTALAFTAGSTVLIARSLGAEGQGIVAVAWLVPTLLSVPFGLGTNVASTHLVGTGRLEVEAAGRASSGLVVMGTLVAAVVAGALAATGTLEALLPNVGGLTIVVAFAALPFLLWRVNLVGLLSGIQRVRVAGATDSALSVLMGAAGLAAASVWRGSELAVVTAWTVAAVVALWLGMRWSEFTPSVLRPRWRTPERAQLLRYGVPAALSNGTQLVAYRLDLLMVNALIGASPAGVYAIATRLSELLWVLPSAAGFVVLSRAAAGGASVTSTTLRVFWATASLGLAAAGVLLLGGWVLLETVLPAFRDAMVPLVVLVPGTVLLGASNVLANDLAGRGHLWRNAAAAGVTATVALVLDVILIPSHGPTGAALASTIAYSVCAIVLLVSFVKTTATPLRSVVRAWRWWAPAEAA